MKTIEIRNGRRSTYGIKEKLKKEGFQYMRASQYCGYWKKEGVSEREICYWKRYRMLGYRCYVYDPELHGRGMTYRQDYFKNNYPNVGSRYHCAYCGKLLPKERLVIDHLIPIQKAKSSEFWQKVLKVTGIENVNNPRNLVGACPRCNSKKGSKTSWWIIRGIIGKHYSIWLSIKVTIIMILLLVLNQFRPEIEQIMHIVLSTIET